MVEHLPVEPLLFHDVMSFLVKYVSQAVESAVEFPAEQPLLVESEVQFLVLEGIQHITDLSACFPDGQEGSHNGCQHNRSGQYQYMMDISHQMLYFFNFEYNVGLLMSSDFATIDLFCRARRSFIWR